jgi:hypothetical protein
MEDLIDPIGTENLGDYNDMIVKVQVVPIPPTLLHLGSGLAAWAPRAPGEGEPPIFRLARPKTF